MGGISFADIILGLGFVVSILIAIFKEPAAKKKLESETNESSAEADESRATAIEKYEQTVTRMAARQENLEKQIDALKEQIRCDRDAYNARIALLEQESQQVQAENIRLRKEVDNLRDEVSAYKVANKSLLHENGALKEWAERLVKQIQGMGVEPTPFVPKVRSNE